MSRLIIVESPSKARTLGRFLGSEYIVLASMGHVRDLPKSKIGVDVEAGFLPEYEVIQGKEKQIKELRAAVKKATATLLAADPDREGEAIAWHLAEALGLRDPDRIVFHEITKLAVDEALGERSRPVRTGVVGDVERPPEIEDRDRQAAGLDLAGLSASVERWWALQSQERLRSVSGV